MPDRAGGVVLPLSYLPSIDQYCFLAQNQTVSFEVYETFPKQTCRNRTWILSANGVFRLTVPVIKPNGNKTKTAEILIDYKTHWNIIHWRAISSAYNKSPFFLYYRDDFEQIFLNPHESLIGFNLSLIDLINKFLKIHTPVELTTGFIKNYGLMEDKRYCDKNISSTHFILKPYTQVFSDRMPFISNLSIIDLLFNEGPLALNYLQEAQVNN
ncbi:MAG TPA: WbqC family protein [Lentimicrobium sp.]|nr:WbqC family protein [Lentimicrobium sp.]